MRTPQSLRQNLHLIAAIQAAYGSVDITTLPAPQGYSELMADIGAPFTTAKYFVNTNANPPFVWYNITTGNTSTVYIRWGTGQSVSSVYNAQNGNIFAINSVVQAPQNISTTLAANAGAGSTSGVSTQLFLAALQAAQMTGSQSTGSLDLLQGTTVFVPSDDAMSKYSSFLSTLTAAQARYVLQYHVIPTAVQYSTTLKSSQYFSTLAGGSTLTVTYNNSTVHAGNGTVILADAFHSNGVIQ